MNLTLEVGGNIGGGGGGLEAELVGMGQAVAGVRKVVDRGGGDHQDPARRGRLRQRY